jgi:hypothetical protein
VNLASERRVYFEVGDRIREAIQRETQIEGWLRSKKIAWVESKNPTWADLAAGWKGKADSSPAAQAQNDPCASPAVSVLETLGTEVTEAFTADTEFPLIEIYATNFCGTTPEPVKPGLTGKGAPSFRNSEGP